MRKAYDEVRLWIIPNQCTNQNIQSFPYYACQDEDIQYLYRIHTEMDKATLACYGLNDLDQPSTFTSINGNRFCIPFTKMHVARFYIGYLSQIGNPGREEVCQD